MYEFFVSGEVFFAIMIILMVSVWCGYIFNRGNGDKKLKEYCIRLELFIIMTFAASSFMLLQWQECADIISKELFVIAYFMGLTLLFVLGLTFGLVPAKTIVVDMEITKEDVIKAIDNWHH